LPGVDFPDVTMRPIGAVHGGRAEPIDDDWGGIESTIVLDDRFPPDSLDGLDGFSHVEVVFVFHRVDDADVVTGARHPRGNTDWPKVGIFAQRARMRPNRIGVTRCELVGVVGRRVHVRGLDAMDGTPVLDLKPHMTGFDARGTVREPAWATELMRDYW
jgi:tRNA-Thr(GGU) m(6)t(6)A37 methyltransferase TsaA